MIEALCGKVLARTAPQGLTHAAVVRSLGGRVAGTVFASSAAARSLIELQETLGEGPVATSLAEHSPVLVADLADDPLASPWVLFAPEAAASSVRSVYAFPLQVGAIALGALVLHGSGPAALEPATLAEVLAARDSLSLALLAPSGSVREEAVWADLLTPGHAVINQAAGMVMAQTEGPLHEAMLRLQAHAVGSGESLIAVSEKVVARTLRFHVDDTPTDRRDNL